MLERPRIIYLTVHGQQTLHTYYCSGSSYFTEAQHTFVEAEY